MLEQNNKRIAKNTLFLYIRMVIVMAINLYVTRAVLDVLGVSDYGVYNVVCGVVSMFGFLNTSMANGIQRFYNFELGKNGECALVRVYNTALFIQFVLTVCIVLLTETFGVWYVNSKMIIDPDRMVAANWIFQFSIISLVFVIMQIPYSAAILAHERMDYYAIVNIIDALMKLAIVFILPHLSGDSLILYGFLVMIISVIDFILYSTYCRIKLKHLKFKRTFDKPLFKSMLSFSGWNLLGSFAYVTKGQGVNVLINAFFGTVINAANGIAAQISSAIQTFAVNIILAFKPQLTQSYAVGDHCRAEDLMFSMSKIAYTLMCIIAIPIMVEINYILNLWLNTNIPANTQSFAILTIIATMIGILNTPVTQMIHAIGKMKKYQIATSIVICSILPISWISLKLGNEATSVFIVTIVIMVINQIVCLRVLHSVFNFDARRYVKDVVMSCVVITTIPLLAASYISTLMPSSIWRLIMVTLVNMLSIITLFYLTMNRNEKIIIKSYLNKFKQKLCYKK